MNSTSGRILSGQWRKIQGALLTRGFRRFVPGIGVLKIERSDNMAGLVA